MKANLNFIPGQLLRRLRGHTKEVTSLSVCAQGTKFVSHSSNKQDGAFRLWDAQTFHCVASFTGDNEVNTRSCQQINLEDVSMHGYSIYPVVFSSKAH